MRSFNGETIMEILIPCAVLIVVASIFFYRIGQQEGYDRGRADVLQSPVFFVDTTGRDLE